MSRAKLSGVATVAVAAALVTLPMTIAAAPAHAGAPVLAAQTSSLNLSGYPSAVCINITSYADHSDNV
jgi:hypothetical protein